MQSKGQKSQKRPKARNLRAFGSLFCSFCRYYYSHGSVSYIKRKHFERSTTLVYHLHIKKCNLRVKKAKKGKKHLIYVLFAHFFAFFVANIIHTGPSGISKESILSALQLWFIICISKNAI